MKRITRFFTDNYNLQQLIHLSKVGINKNRTCASGSYSGTYSLFLKDRCIYDCGKNKLLLEYSENKYNNHISILTIHNLCGKVINNIIDISSGVLHSLLLTSDGDVYSRKYNECGNLISNRSRDKRGLSVIKLPINNIKPQTYIHELLNISDVIQISTKNQHSLILTKSGYVYSFGYNEYGQLGLGEYPDSSDSPIFIPNLINIIQVSAGSFHSLVLTNDGQVYGFGDNAQGEIIYANYIEDDDIVNYIWDPILIPGLNNIIQISAGDGYSLALNKFGDVFAWGWNENGELGFEHHIIIKIPRIIPGLGNIIQISAGYSHSLALTNDGKVYIFGDPSKSETDAINYCRDTIPTLLKSSDDILLNNIIFVSAGFDHSLLMTYDKQIYAFGKNKYGQLGLGDYINRNNPTTITY